MIVIPPFKNSSAIPKSLGKSIPYPPISAHQEEWFSDWENFSERVGETQVQAKSSLGIGEEKKSKKSALVEIPHKLRYHQLLVVCQVIKAVPEHQVVVVAVTH